MVYQFGINKGIILRCTAYQISRKSGSCFCIVWVSVEMCIIL